MQSFKLLRGGGIGRSGGFEGLLRQYFLKARCTAFIQSFDCNGGVVNTGFNRDNCRYRFKLCKFFTCPKARGPRQCLPEKIN